MQFQINPNKIIALFSRSECLFSKTKKTKYYNFCGGDGRCASVSNYKGSRL